LVAMFKCIPRADSLSAFGMPKANKKGVRQLRSCRVIIGVVSLVACLVLVSGCLGPEKGTLSGLIKDSGDPVVGATVFIPALKLTTITSAEGAYSFDKVSSGTHTMVVYKDNEFLAVMENVTVDEAESATVNIKVDEAKSREVTGTVSVKYGEDVLAGATVFLSIGKYNVSQNTDEKGRFVFPSVPFGDYLVKVTLDGVDIYEESFVVDSTGELIVKASVVVLDPNLEQSVRNMISKPKGVLLAEDVAGIEKIDERDKGIKSLKGLEYFSSLGYLRLDRNDVEDLSPLSKISGLREIILDENPRVVDISPLANHPHLHRLRIHYTSVTDFTALKGHAALQNIEYHGAKITDLSTLPSLPNLKEFHAGWSVLESIAGIERFPQLWQVIVGNSRVTDLSPLLQLPALTTVWLDAGQQEKYPETVQVLQAKGVTIKTL
jgi:hypothetical protein